MKTRRAKCLKNIFCFGGNKGEKVLSNVKFDFIECQYWYTSVPIYLYHNNMFDSTSAMVCYLPRIPTSNI